MQLVHFSMCLKHRYRFISRYVTLFHISTASNILHTRLLYLHTFQFVSYKYKKWKSGINFLLLNGDDSAASFKDIAQQL